MNRTKRLYQYHLNVWDCIVVMTILISLYKLIKTLTLAYINSNNTVNINISE